MIDVEVMFDIFIDKLDFHKIEFRTLELYPSKNDSFVERFVRKNEEKQPRYFE